MTVTYLARQYAEKALLPFHDKNACSNAPEDYIVRTFCIVLYFFALQSFLLLGFRVILQPKGHFFYEKFLSVYWISGVLFFLREEHKLKMKFNLRLMHISIIRLTFNLKPEKKLAVLSKFSFFCKIKKSIVLEDRYHFQTLESSSVGVGYVAWLLFVIVCAFKRSTCLTFT